MYNSALMMFCIHSVMLVSYQFMHAFVNEIWTTSHYVHQLLLLYVWQHTLWLEYMDI